MKPGDLIKNEYFPEHGLGLLLSWEEINIKFDDHDDDIRIPKASILENGVVMKYRAENVRRMWTVINAC